MGKPKRIIDLDKSDCDVRGRFGDNYQRADGPAISKLAAEQGAARKRVFRELIEKQLAAFVLE